MTGWLPIFLAFWFVATLTLISSPFVLALDLSRKRTLIVLAVVAVAAAAFVIASFSGHYNVGIPHLE